MRTLKTILFAALLVCGAHAFACEDEAAHTSAHKTASMLVAANAKAANATSATSTDAHAGHDDHAMMAGEACNHEGHSCHDGAKCDHGDGHACKENCEECAGKHDGNHACPHCSGKAEAKKSADASTAAPDTSTKAQPAKKK